jgi:hypothetical protein
LPARQTISQTRELPPNVQQRIARPGFDKPNCQTTLCEVDFCLISASIIILLMKVHLHKNQQRDPAGGMQDRTTKQIVQMTFVRLA